MILLEILKSRDISDCNEKLQRVHFFFSVLSHHTSFLFHDPIKCFSELVHHLEVQLDHILRINLFQLALLLHAIAHLTRQ